MKCFIVAATPAEIAPAMRHLQNNVQKLRPGMAPLALFTGVGMLGACHRLTRYIHKMEPDLIIQAGIAGCFDTAVPLASVFAIKKEALADTGVWQRQQWLDVFDLGLQKKSAAPFKNGWLPNPHKDILKKTRLPAALAVTVNQISTGKKNIAAIREKYNPLLESMEGAALHYTALEEAVPFLQLRSVSNYAGERNKKKWDINGAVESLNRELIRIFESL